MKQIISSPKLTPHLLVSSNLRLCRRLIPRKPWYLRRLDVEKSIINTCGMEFTSKVGVNSLAIASNHTEACIQWKSFRTRLISRHHSELYKRKEILLLVRGPTTIEVRRAKHRRCRQESSSSTVKIFKTIVSSPTTTAAATTKDSAVMKTGFSTQWKSMKAKPSTSESASSYVSSFHFCPEWLEKSHLQAQRSSFSSHSC